MAEKEPRRSVQATMAEVQLTMARAQLAMAEALRALSAGSVPVARETGEGIGPQYVHEGRLGFDPDDASQLALIDSEGTVWRLDDFDAGKWLRLELRLGEAQLAPKGLGDPPTLMRALGAYMDRRNALIGTAAAECNQTNPPPPQT
jgi:hypothetical protein